MRRDIIKPSVSKLEAYEPEPQTAKAVLNANESSLNLPQNIRDEIVEKISKLSFNRYPDPSSRELIQTFSDYIGIEPENVIAGNGLDEILSIITNAFIEKGDSVVSHEPGFSMYRIWTEIAGGNYIAVEDKPDFQIDYKGLIDKAIANQAKLIFICSPNNPTGAKISLHELEEVLEGSPSLVILDEAYADFGEDSFIDLIGSFDNLILLKTMSKAMRFAGGRCGFACGPKELIDILKKVKAPYNLNALTQTAAKVVLEHADELEDSIQAVKKERERMFKALSEYDSLNVYPSHANFLFVTTDEHERIADVLSKNDLLVRYFPDLSAFRITIGTEEENDSVLESIKEALR